MKTLKTVLFALLMSVLAVPAMAQTAVTRTTLSSAVSAGSQNNLVTLASSTGISLSTASGQNYILVDRELMLVRSLQSGTTYNVARAQASTIAAGHLSGATVIYGAGGGTWNPNSGNTSGVFLGGASAMPTGSCTRTSQQYLPVFALPNFSNAGYAFDCLGGQWVQGVWSDGSLAVTRNLIGPCTITIGPTAYGSVGTDTTTSTTVEYVASIFVPSTFVSTGFSNLNGSAVNTGSKKIFILHDSSGKLLANTATAGTAATGNDAFQAIAWTATKILVGPAFYLVSLQDDTADVAGIRTIAASTYNNVLASGPTSVFGTVGNITAPTTFTADVGPVGCLY